MEQPKGTFKCLVCGLTWDGSELLPDPQNPIAHPICGDAFCGANVTKISENPKT